MLKKGFAATAKTVAPAPVPQFKTHQEELPEEIQHAVQGPGELGVKLLAPAEEQVRKANAAGAEAEDEPTHGSWY